MGGRKDVTGSKTKNLSYDNHSINDDDHCIIIVPFECYVGIFFITSTTTKSPGAELPTHAGAPAVRPGSCRDHVPFCSTKWDNDIHMFHVLGTPG